MDAAELAERPAVFREAYLAGLEAGDVTRCRQWAQASTQMAAEAAGAAASMPPVEISVDGLSSGAAFRADTETSVRARDAAEGFEAAAVALEAREVASDG